MDGREAILLPRPHDTLIGPPFEPVPPHAAKSLFTRAERSASLRRAVAGDAVDAGYVIAAALRRRFRRTRDRAGCRAADARLSRGAGAAAPAIRRDRGVRRRAAREAGAGGRDAHARPPGRGCRGATARISEDALPAARVARAGGGIVRHPRSAEVPAGAHRDAADRHRHPAALCRRADFGDAGRRASPGRAGPRGSRYRGGECARPARAGLLRPAARRARIGHPPRRARRAKPPRRRCGEAGAGALHQPRATPSGGGGAGRCGAGI